MTKLAVAIGVLAVAFGAVVPASANFAVIKFRDGSCHVWTDTKNMPMGKMGADWVWVGKPVMTKAAADHRGAWAMKKHWCKSWS
jgi:hypothetical protein